MSPAGAGGAAKVFGLEGNHLVVNAAKSRYFELQLGEPSDKMSFTLIGGDGGLQEYAVEQETLAIAPGERVDAVVVPHGKPGSEVVVTDLVYDRGYGSGYDGTHDLLTLSLTGPPSASGPPHLAELRSTEPIRRSGATDI